MASITPGTGATIIANTLETQLGHSFWLLKQYQSLPEYNFAGLNYVQAGFSQTEPTYIGSFDLPCTRELINGKPTFTVTNYLQNVPFTPGNPLGSFVSLTLPSYFLELLTFTQSLESNPQFNPGEMNNISGTYDTDTSSFSGELVLPVKSIINSTGVVTTNFLEYLTYSGTGN